MRGRLILPILLAALFIGIEATHAAAQNPPPGGGGPQGRPDQTATGEILGDETGAEVSAGETTDFGPTNVAYRGGGNVVCTLHAMRPSLQSPVPGHRVDEAELQALYEQTQEPVPVYRVCRDGDTGAYLSTQVIAWTPGTSLAPDPYQLALLARSRLPFELPAARTNPFLWAHLANYLWVENWPEEPPERSAQAGGVVATAIATPREQRWELTDAIRPFDPAEHLVRCFEAGTPFDPTVTHPPAPTCGWTSTHASSGQPTRSVDGEPCFPVTVTVFWQVTWTSNVGTGGALGTVPRSSSFCLPVGEVQAIETG